MSLIDVQRRLLTVDDVAERLGVSRRTVERKIARGELPAFQLGGPRLPVRVDERELEEWLTGAALLVFPGEPVPEPSALRIPGCEPPDRPPSRPRTATRRKPNGGHVY